MARLDRPAVCLRALDGAQGRQSQRPVAARGSAIRRLEEGVDALRELAEPRPDLIMLPRDIASYIRGFRYFIGRPEQRAIDQFRRYLEQPKADIGIVISRR